MDSYYDQPEHFWCDNCGDRFPLDEYNNGLCAHCEELRKEDENNAEN